MNLVFSLLKLIAMIKLKTDISSKIINLGHFRVNDIKKFAQLIFLEIKKKKIFLLSTSCSLSSGFRFNSSVLISVSSSLRLFRAKDWSISKELYMGVTNSFSVDANLSQLMVQMCRVIHVCDNNQTNHNHTC